MARVRNIYVTVDEAQGWLCSDVMTDAEVEAFNQEYSGIMHAE